MRRMLGIMAAVTYVQNLDASMVSSSSDMGSRCCAPCVLPASQSAVVDLELVAWIGVEVTSSACRGVFAAGSEHLQAGQHACCPVQAFWCLCCLSALV